MSLHRGPDELPNRYLLPSGLADIRYVEQPANALTTRASALDFQPILDRAYFTIALTASRTSAVACLVASASGPTLGPSTTQLSW